MHFVDMHDTPRVWGSLRSQPPKDGERLDHTPCGKCQSRQRQQTMPAPVPSEGEGGQMPFYSGIVMYFIEIGASLCISLHRVLLRMCTVGMGTRNVVLFWWGEGRGGGALEGIEWTIYDLQNGLTACIARVPLRPGSVALHCRSSTAHCPQVVRQCIAEVAPPTAPRR